MLDNLEQLVQVWGAERNLAIHKRVKAGSQGVHVGGSAPANREVLQCMIMRVFEVFVALHYLIPCKPCSFPVHDQVGFSSP